MYPSKPPPETLPFEAQTLVYALRGGADVHWVWCKGKTQDWQFCLRLGSVNKSKKPVVLCRGRLPIIPLALGLVSHENPDRKGGAGELASGAVSVGGDLVRDSVSLYM